MARTIGAVCKRCRREGTKLFLKGTRCNSSNCPFSRGNDPGAVKAPGMHGARKPKTTDYGLHLREKQKVKTFYGVLERQFRKYYQMAERAKGNTGENLMILLERRLDNVVFRLGFATSRAQARMMVAHGHITVNGGRVNVASFLVRPGDQIAVKNRKGSLDYVKNATAGFDVGTVDYLVRNEGDIPSGSVLRNPLYEDVSVPVNPQLIVELCSR